MKFWAFALLATANVLVPTEAYVPNGRFASDLSEVSSRLGKRDATCLSSNPVSCSAVDSKLPSNFCCSSGTTCNSLDQSSSAICCPTGTNCSTIAPINCDVGLQDASKNSGPIFTTRTGDKLPTCGSQCCPFGYVCSQSGGNSVCALDKSRSGTATTAKLTSTTSTTVTSTPSGFAQGIDSNNPPPTKESNNFPVGVFFAGFFPGILVGVLATLAWVVMTKRNKKAPDTRGLNLAGHGARPFISLPLQTAGQNNDRSDFLSRTRSRARSMFSTHRRSRTVDSTDFWNAKMPTPPTVNNVPVNYVNDMPNVPVTPARRVARYNSDERLTRAETDEKGAFSPTNPEPHQREGASPMPDMPAAAVPPLRGMNTQRRISPPYGTMNPTRTRRDSGTAMGTFGSPFQTPEKKPQLARENTPSIHVTYGNVNAESPTEPPPQILTPARYDPNSTKDPPTAAFSAIGHPAEAQQHNQPIIPPRPQVKNLRPFTQASDFDFDEGLNDPPSPQKLQSPPREAYKSQIAGNPYASSNVRANPTSTFDSFGVAGVGGQTDKKDKHATNATTFTTMLRNVGFPDPGDQIPGVPKLDVKKAREKGRGKKGMI